MVKKMTLAISVVLLEIGFVFGFWFVVHIETVWRHTTTPQGLETAGSNRANQLQGRAYVCRGAAWQK